MNSKEINFLYVDTIQTNLYINWGAASIGFGELHIFYDQEEEVLVCDSEMMSKEFVRAALLKFVDKVLAEAIFDDTPEYSQYYERLKEKDERKNIHFPGNGI